MKISIIGGGITGLTTALALHKVGIASTVFEKASELNEIGAGIWLQPNAIKVLKYLGIYDEIFNAGSILNRMEICYPNLKPIKQIKSNIVHDENGNKTLAIHRGKLQSILYNKCEELGLVKLDMPYVSHQESNKKIVIQFSETSLETDILLGADGIHSQVRQSMGLPYKLRKTGQICARGIAHFTLPKNLQHDGKEVWGDKRRFGFSQVSPNTVYFFTVINEKLVTQEINPTSLSSYYKDFDPLVVEIIRACENMHIAELSDLKRLNTWHNDHVCLLGDAAHATTPNMGQGACQGIEDAYYISQELKEFKDINQAFAAFEKKRRKKVDYVVNNSWTFGKLAHRRIGQLTLKTVMKLTPSSVINRQMNQLYAIEGL